MNTAQARRPQLNAEELQQLKWMLGGLLTLLAVGTIFYMDVDAWTLMALTSIAALASMARPTFPSRMPRLLHTLAFPAIVAFFAADLWLKGEVLPAMVRLDILLLLYRNISYRQRRDDLQVVVLGLFLVVVAGVLTVSLTFAVHLLVYTACSLALLLTITLSDGGGKSSAPKPAAVDPTQVPAWAAHADWRGLLRRLRMVTDWRVLGLGALLFAGVVAVSALLFLAIPRFQIENSMFLDRFISKKAKSGFTDTITFGDVTDIQQDNSVALSVDVSNQAEVPASPYWRMVTLDYYENGTFRLSVGLRSTEFQQERNYTSLAGEASMKRGAAQWTFYLEPGVSRYLPLLGLFNRVLFRETQNFRVAPRLGIVALREEPAAMTAYRVEGFDIEPMIEDKAFAARWKARSSETSTPRSALQDYLRINENDRATVRGIVTEITGGAQLSASEFAQRAGEWLRRQHAYSLSPRVPTGIGDPLVRWMASREAGHCELFAGSFVVLARAAGFPCRVVTGFRGGTWNAYSNNFTIRNSDAHAWAEIFDEAASGWLRTDPLAPSAATQDGDIRGEAAIVSRMDRSWKARLDSLRVFWYRRIVSFDQRSQIETLKAVKDATQQTGRRLREWMSELVGDAKEWLLSPWDTRRIGNLLGVLAALIGVGWVWREFGRSWWRGLARRRGHRQDPMRREAARWLERIEQAGSAGGELENARAELQRIRFGARETWQEPEKIFRRTRHALREARRTQKVTRS